jgi:hypothetical protein
VFIEFTVQAGDEMLRDGQGTINMVSKVWFITGTSRGFGRVWAESALARGDRVAATARDVRRLASLVAGGRSGMVSLSRPRATWGLSRLGSHRPHGGPAREGSACERWLWVDRRLA